MRYSVCVRTYEDNLEVRSSAGYFDSLEAAKLDAMKRFLALKPHGNVTYRVDVCDSPENLLMTLEFWRLIAQ